MPKPAITQWQVFEIEDFADNGVSYGSIKLGRLGTYGYHSKDSMMSLIRLDRWESFAGTRMESI
ncbi:MAG: hypothetical protein HDS84_06755 [Bacteroidales bacterium]|nr:hypothetical protein [Bacteroidales bacterium]